MRRSFFTGFLISLFHGPLAESDGLHGDPGLLQPLLGLEHLIPVTKCGICIVLEQIIMLL